MIRQLRERETKSVKEGDRSVKEGEKSVREGEKEVCV